MATNVTSPRRPALATVLSGVFAIVTLAALDRYFPRVIQRFDAVTLDYLMSREPSTPTGKVVITVGR